MVLYDVSMYVPASKTAIKSRLPNGTDYTVNCFETDAEANITNTDYVQEFFNAEFIPRNLIGHDEVLKYFPSLHYYEYYY